MRTLQRVRSQASKVGFARVGSLIVLGALIWMLFSTARDARNWSWLIDLAKEQRAKEAQRMTVGQEKKLELAVAQEAILTEQKQSRKEEPEAKPPEAKTAAETEKQPESKTQPETEKQPESVKPVEPSAPFEPPVRLEPIKPAPVTPTPATPAPETGKAEPAAEPKSTESEPKTTEPKKTESTDGSENKPAFEEGSGKQEAPPAKAKSGPTDLDDEEQDAVEEEFQAISDGSLDLHRAEMPAYWRIFRWVKSQSVKQLTSRATKMRLDDMFRRSDKVRGKIVKMDLHVQRVLSYPVADPNIAEVTKVYEIWGWSDETKSWLYCCLTSELPDDMPLGSDLHERVTFVGYFYKVQGYHAAKSKPNERPLSAPLLIGKVTWHRQAPPPAPAPAQPIWIWGSIGVAALLFIGGCLYPFLRSKPPREELPPRSDLKSLNEWATRPVIDPDPDVNPDENPRARIRTFHLN